MAYAVVVVEENKLAFSAFLGLLGTQVSMFVKIKKVNSPYLLFLLADYLKTFVFLISITSYR
jgi:hypothetical protein